MGHRNNSIDLFRFLGAFSVFLSHSIYANQWPLLPLIGRWTVPFFFMVSGYYFQKNYAHSSIRAFTKTAKTLLSLILVANLVYLFFLLLTVGSLKTLLTHFTLLVGTYFHLWYLTSLAIGHLVLWIILSLKLERALPYLAAIVLVLILGLNPYNQVVGIEAHPIYARSLLSIPFLCIGFLVARYRVDIPIPKPVSLLLICLGSTLQGLEAWLLLRDWQASLTINFVVGTLFLSVGMFLLSLQLSVANTSRLSDYGRRYSLPFYLYHPMFTYLLTKGLAATKVSAIIYWLSPVLTMLSILLLFILLDRFTPALFRILSGNFININWRPRLVKTF